MATPSRESVGEDETWLFLKYVCDVSCAHERDLLRIVEWSSDAYLVTRGSGRYYVFMRLCPSRSRYSFANFFRVGVGTDSRIPGMVYVYSGHSRVWDFVVKDKTAVVSRLERPADDPLSCVLLEPQWYTLFASGELQRLCQVEAGGIPAEELDEVIDGVYGNATAVSRWKVECEEESRRREEMHGKTELLIDELIETIKGEFPLANSGSSLDPRPG
jgi:hypothetical protein